MLKFNEIQEAYDYVAFCNPGEAAAYVGKEQGRVVLIPRFRKRMIMQLSAERAGAGRSRTNFFAPGRLRQLERLFV